MPVPVEQAYAWLLPCRLTSIFDAGSARSPPCREVTDQRREGDWGTVGQSRTIRTADGGSLREELTTRGAAAPASDTHCRTSPGR